MRPIALAPSARAAGGAVLIAAVLALPLAAHAHSRGTPSGPDSGLKIPALTHGQMAGIAPFRSEILALAERHRPADETLQRLANHARIQFSWCLWGLMPGTVTDETSPFNTCAHAYLAATRSALLRLEEITGDRAETQALVRQVEIAMMQNAAALELCAYSSDDYTTAAIVRPDWPLLPRHIPSLGLLAVVGLGLSAVLSAFLRLTRPAP